MLKFLLIVWVSFSVVYANKVQILDLRIKKENSGMYTFYVTLLHKDSSWEHYANRWEIMDEKGKVLGTRVLVHPHLHEQPFTRSLSNVKIPRDVRKIWIRAHDTVHGYHKKRFKFRLK